MECGKALRAPVVAACWNTAVNPGLELLVQLVGTISNPLVIGVSLLMPFLWPRPAAVRVGAAVMAGMLGLLDAMIGGAPVWGLLLVAVSLAGRLVVAQVALCAFLPVVAMALSYARSTLLWLRGR